MVATFKLQPLRASRQHFGFGHRLIQGGSRSPQAVIGDLSFVIRSKIDRFRFRFPFKALGFPASAPARSASAPVCLLLVFDCTRGDA